MTRHLAFWSLLQGKFLLEIKHYVRKSLTSLTSPPLKTALHFPATKSSFLISHRGLIFLGWKPIEAHLSGPSPLHLPTEKLQVLLFLTVYYSFLNECEHNHIRVTSTNPKVSRQEDWWISSSHWEASSFVLIYVLKHKFPVQSSSFYGLK